MQRYGGFVKWEMGAKDDGSDSIAVQVKPAPRAARLALDMHHFDCHASHVTRHTSHVTRRLLKVAPESHWPELVALVCVVNANKKAVSSTSGMMNR